MTSFTGSQISQELLSAYIDGEVNSQEQRLVEQALAADPEIAWEVESLRRTVALLGDLPAIALPQSFVLPEARVADVVATRRAAHRQKTSQAAPSLGPSLGDRWQSLLDFLGGGNLVLRNAAGVAAVAFLVLLAGDAFIGAPTLPAPQAMSQPMPAAAPVIAQADAQSEAAEVAVMAEEKPAAKAMPASQDVAQDAEPAAAPAAMAFAEESAEPAQDAAPLIPDAAPPMTLGAEPRTGVGGGGDGLGAGGGGEITAPQPQPFQAAPAALARSAPPAADIQRIAPTPAETESANQDMVGAASLSITEMSAAPTGSVTELAPESAPQTAVATPTPQAIVMSEPAAEPAPESAPAIAVTEAPALSPAFAPAPAAAAQPAVPSAPTPQPAEGPFVPLRLAQLGLALLALLLSGLWVRSR